MICKLYPCKFIRKKKDMYCRCISLTPKFCGQRKELVLLSSTSFGTKSLLWWRFFQVLCSMASDDHERLQNSLGSLSLDSGEEESTHGSLVGKLLTTRKIQCFIMAKEVEKVWKLRGEVWEVALSFNTFKFIFSKKEQKERIFKQRLWSI